MNLKIYVLLVCLKIIAILTVMMGIHVQIITHDDLGNVLITLGSLIFSVLSNITMFNYIFRREIKKKVVRNHEQYNAKNATFTSTDDSTKCFTGFKRHDFIIIKADGRESESDTKSV